MQSWNVMHILAMMFPIIFYEGTCSSGVEFEPCLHTLKNNPCNMTCRVPDFARTIAFQCNGSSRGACNLFGCTANIIRNESNTVHLQIPSLSYATDNCKWSCTYGTTQSTSYLITIYSGIPSSLNLTSQTDDKEIKLTAIADCLYPSDPSANVEYRYEGNGQYSQIVSQIDLQSFNLPGICNFDIERRLTAFSVLSGNQGELTGRRFFLRMTFLQYPAAYAIHSNEVGPFYYQGLQCSVNCINNTCNGSQYCTEGCLDGYWGQTCDVPCPVNCKNSNCYRNNGHCISCVTGFFDDNCTSVCSTYCSGKFCDKPNGECTQGCMQGWYGDTCNRICSSICAGGTCDQQSGICTALCIQNWTECLCNRQQMQDSEHTLTLYGVIAALCISVGFNAYTIMWILRQRIHKRQKGPRDKKSNESTNNDSITNPEIYDTLDDNAEYQELGQVTGPSHYDQTQKPKINIM